MNQPNDRIYLDYAAATPLLPEAKAAMEPFFEDCFANPSAIHTEGRKAREAIELARQDVAQLLGIRPEGVVFTGSGTEANNLAIFGVIETLRASGRSYESMEIVSTKLEHPSVLRVLDNLASQGVDVRYSPVDGEGRIIEKEFTNQLTEKTVLVTFAYVNSEIGVIQDVRRFVRAVRAFENTEKTSIVVHIDGAQAPLWLPCDLTRLGADILTLDAGKCYGPKGVGVLAQKGGVKMVPHFFGGGQEGGLRPGTENTPLIVGCAFALHYAQTGFEERSKQVSALRDYLIASISEKLPEAILNGPSGENRVANNVNISLPGLDTEYAVVTLDHKGVSASTKSACGGAGGGRSEVVFAISKDEIRATSTLRFTLHKDITYTDLDRVVVTLKDYIVLMKKI